MSSATVMTDQNDAITFSCDAENRVVDQNLLADSLNTHTDFVGSSFSSPASCVAPPADVAENVDQQTKHNESQQVANNSNGTSTQEQCCDMTQAEVSDNSQSDPASSDNTVTHLHQINAQNIEIQPNEIPYTSIELHIGSDSCMEPSYAEFKATDNLLNTATSTHADFELKAEPPIERKEKPFTDAETIVPSVLTSLPVLEAVSKTSAGETVVEAELHPAKLKAVAEDADAKAACQEPGHSDSVYYIKWIMFNGGKVPIITQNENGPCPLLAIMNVLLLKGKIKLAPMLEMVTSEQLMAYLGECVIESMPKNLTETAQANYEQNMQDAMAIMHKLQTGLDVNVKFTEVNEFEYTPECIIFDLLEIGLYHGWLVDPQDEQNVTIVGKCSYNQLVEKIIEQKASDQEPLQREALIAEQFLDRTASQLTYHGLCELSSTVKEQELCIFFRNNHFNTLYRHNNELFLLVTDQGFLTESNVVWETLSNVDGDCHFVDADFNTFTKPETAIEPIPASYSSGDTQIDSDYQVALSLQQDQHLMAGQEGAWGQFHKDINVLQHADHELAVRLQEEEDMRAAAAMQEHRQQPHQGPQQSPNPAHTATGDRRPRERESREEKQRDKKESKDCQIL